MKDLKERSAVGARVSCGIGLRNCSALLFGAIACAALLANPFEPSAAEGRSGLNADRHKGSCEFSHVQLVRLSSNRQPYVLTVRSLGRKCRSASIMADISDAPGRSVWREALRLTTFEGGDPPNASFNPSQAHVRRLVQNWASLENTGQAPAWMQNAVRPMASSSEDPTVYLTSLRRADYERVRRAREPMVCVPIGPETGHCIATLRLKVTVFMTRGI